jgi:hypothetical protein
VPERYSPKKRKNLCGVKIRHGRENHRPVLTQDQLSGRLAALSIVLDRTAIAKIESGQRCVYDYDLKAFAAVLGLAMEQLVETPEIKRP